MEVKYTFTFEQLKGQPLQEFLSRVIEEKRQFKVVMPGGETVTLQIEAELPPLPELDGYVPDGWKEAIYAQ